MKVTLLQMSGTVLKKSICLKIIYCRLFSGIRTYFEKQREIELFYLIAEVEYCNTVLVSSLTNT